MARGGDGGNERTIFSSGTSRSGVRLVKRAKTPQPQPVGGGSGTAAPIPDAARPKPVGSVLTGDLTPLLGIGTPGGFLRRLFRPASQLSS